MKVLVFCNNKLCAQMVFELIRKRIFAGIIIPKTNTELIREISDSGYLEDKQIHTPSLDDDNELIEIVKTVNPDVCFTLTFPLIFKKSLLEIPPMGFYNFHFGLLPEFRSVDPIFWQIRNVAKKAGLCVHKMNAQIDAGAILFQQDMPIKATDTYGSLFYKLAAFSTMKLNEVLELIRKDTIDLKDQNQKNAKYYPKPSLKDVNIDWQNMEMTEIIATINAANPWNKGAITSINGEEYRILQATPASYDKELPDKAGLVFYADEKQGAFVICKNKKLLRIDAVYCSLGFVSGGQILGSGINKGKAFK